MRQVESLSVAQQRQHSNRVRTASRRALESAEQAQVTQEINRVNQSSRRSAARQATHDRNRRAIEQFKTSVYVGPFNSYMFLLQSLVLQ